jgi:diguanylate cyclase (GGDEF)-like protein
VRLLTRDDTSLTVALIAGAIVLFQRPLRVALEMAREVESRYDLDLVPALTIIAGVFAFHQYRKWQVARAEALVASAEAERARIRSAELERLVKFGQSLATSLDVPTLQQVLSRELPLFAGDRGFWVLARAGGCWHEILQDTTRAPRQPLHLLEARSDRAIAGDSGVDGYIDRAGGSETACFAMHAGGVPIGVLGIEDPNARAGFDQQTVEAAAGMIAIALRTVQLFDQTRDQSIRDHLTGCFKREHCLETLDTELRRARRSGRSLALVMFDIDNFKTINDELGHLKGDEILRAVGAQLARLLRSSDVRCRYGGDEFLIILPDTNLAGAAHVVEILRRAIAALAIAGPGAGVLPVHISAGLSIAGPEELDVSGFVKRTDEALYRAKRAGRNRVCVAQLPELAASDVTIDHPIADAPAKLDGRGTETILVADDEPLIRNLIRACLEPLGYNVLLAGNGADALNVATTYQGPIHLLLSDIIMPDLDGRELARRINRVKPAIRTVFISGFPTHAATDATHGGLAAGFLAKPFKSADLVGKIREQIDARQAASREFVPKNTTRTKSPALRNGSRPPLGVLAQWSQAEPADRDDARRQPRAVATGPGSGVRAGGDRACLSQKD